MKAGSQINKTVIGSIIGIIILISLYGLIMNLFLSPLLVDFNATPDDDAVSDVSDNSVVVDISDLDGESQDNFRDSITSEQDFSLDVQPEVDYVHSDGRYYEINYSTTGTHHLPLLILSFVTSFLILLLTGLIYSEIGTYDVLLIGILGVLIIASIAPLMAYTTEAQYTTLSQDPVDDEISNDAEVLEMSDVHDEMFERVSSTASSSGGIDEYESGVFDDADYVELSGEYYKVGSGEGTSLIFVKRTIWFVCVSLVPLIGLITALEE